MNFMSSCLRGEKLVLLKIFHAQNKNIKKSSFQFAKTNFRPKMNLKKAQKSLKLYVFQLF